MDLSSLEGNSVNDRISIPWCSLAYVCVEDAVQEVAAMGRSPLMAKVDICQAYRAIPVHPADHDLLGMIWNGKTVHRCSLALWAAINPQDVHGSGRHGDMDHTTAGGEVYHSLPG